ncbi:MAG: hypothetical protein NC310_08080 [Roseburia sp.]|nr:hypothetical protein [Roseburia sp.]
MKFEPQILCVSHTIIYEKCKTFIAKFLKPFRIIGHKLAIIFDICKTKIKDKFHRWYYEFYQKKYPAFKRKMRKWMSIIAIIEILFTIALFVSCIFSNNEFVLLGRWFSLEITAGTIGFEFGFYFLFVFFMKHYHFLYGDESNHEIDREYTKQYVVAYAPRIGKTHGDTGKGKDETNAGLSTMFIEGFKEDIAKRKAEIKKICYIFNFEKVDSILPEYLDMFYSSNEKVTKENFMRLCSLYGYFIKLVYRYKIDIKTFIMDCKILKKNSLYKAEYIYDQGGINKKHFLNLLYDYVMLSVREYENTFIFANQPFIEDLEMEQPAAIFSMNYLITRTQKDRTFKEKNDFGQEEEVEYTERVQFPFKDYLGFLETEVGTWYINLDKQITAMLLDLGIRDFKAFNRHMFPHFFWLQADQDPERVSKLFRELDHYYIYPDTRIVYSGGEGINFFIKRKLEDFQIKLEKLYKRYEAYKNKTTRWDQRIKKYNRYWIATSNIKYKNKMNDLKESRKVFNIEKESKQLNENIHTLFQEMTLNIFNHSYIEKIITIGKAPSRYNGGTIYMPKDIIENPDIVKSSYSVKLTFRVSDCWRYNTHYMESLSKKRAELSELTLMEARKWNLNLEMTADDIIYLAYLQAAAFTGIPVEQIIKTRYKRKNTFF